jgi:hypothetical protein
MNCNHLEIKKWGGPLILSAAIASFSMPTAFNMCFVACFTWDWSIF